MTGGKKPMARPRRHASGRRRLPSAVAMAAIAVLLAVAGVAVARYALQQREAGVATAESFHFSSDYLKEEGEGAFYYVDPQTDGFSIELRNFADSQRFAAADITYCVAATGADVADSAGGTLQGGVASTATRAVAPTASSFTIEVESTSPYAEKLVATFEKAQGNRYEVEDAAGNAAAVLTLTCTDSGAPVSLTLPAGVVPDATDDRVTPDGGGWRFQASGSGAYSLVLLKSDAAKSLSCQSTPFADGIDLKEQL